MGDSGKRIEMKVYSNQGDSKGLEPEMIRKNLFYLFFTNVDLLSSETFSVF